MSENNNMDRRELIKGLATVPVFGLFLVKLWQKMRRDAIKKSNILSNLVQENSAPAVIKNLSDSRHLNIGIIGYGGRGSHLVRGAGFATKGWTDTVAENAKKNKLDKQFETYKSFFINQIIKNDIKIIYTIKPLDSYVYFSILDENCVQKNKINEILNSHLILDCDILDN